MALKDFVFTDRSVSSSEDIQVTKGNFVKLERMLCDLLNSEQDAIAKVNISETLKALIEFRAVIEDAK